MIQKENQDILMARLEDLTIDSVVYGLIPDGSVTIKHVQMFGDQVAEVTFVDVDGRTDSQLVCRYQEQLLEIIKGSNPFPQN